MKKNAVGVLVIFLASFVFLGWILIRPSGKIDDYEAYYANDTVLPAKGSVKLIFFGVSTLLIDDGETQLLVDGFFSRPSLWNVLTSKVATNEKLIDTIVAKYQMNRVAGVFVTHSHYDHAFDAAYVSKKTKATLHGSLSTLNIGRGGGLKEEQMALFRPGKEIQVGRFSITVVKSKHSPATLVNNDLGEIIDIPLLQPARVSKYVEGESCDFLIKHNGNSIYIKPSANYLEGVLDSIKADVLLLGIGAFGRQSESFKEEYYKQTVSALTPSLVIPLHWDNFFLPASKNLEMMPVLMDNTSKGFDYLIKKTKIDSIELKILQSGKGIVLFAAE